MKGIYIIKNTINNKCYIGKAIDVNDRMKDHKYLLEDNKHTNKHLQASWNKYGAENFTFNLLEACDNLSSTELKEKEKHYIKQYKSNNYQFGYNKTSGGEGGSDFTEETKQRISQSLKGRKKKPSSQKTINRRNETRKEYNVPGSMTGKEPWNKGLTKENNETIKQISQKTKGITRSEETKQKMRESFKGRIISKEQRQKQSEIMKSITPWNKNRKMTDEEKEIRKEKMQGRNAWNKGKKKIKDKD